VITLFSKLLSCSPWKTFSELFYTLTLVVVGDFIVKTHCILSF